MDEPAKDRIGAAIDIGGNSVHLLVARVEPSPLDAHAFRLDALDDRSDLIGLGDAVDRHAAVPPEVADAVSDSVVAMVGVARGLGAADVLLVGTDPFRRAANGTALAGQVERQAGLPVRVLSEHEEAALTFIGVTGAAPPGGSLATVDIGGGSTEVGLYVPGRPLHVVPLPVGSARLSNEIVRHDPPTRSEVDRLLAAARASVANTEWPAAADVRCERAVFVGGTATNIGRMGQLSAAQLRTELAVLTSLPADEVVQRYGVRPRRARQLSAGIAIVSALLERFELAAAEVSEASLRDGLILAAALLGDRWPERLIELTGGARRGAG